MLGLRKSHSHIKDKLAPHYELWYNKIVVNDVVQTQNATL